MPTDERQLFGDPVSSEAHPTGIVANLLCAVSVFAFLAWFPRLVKRQLFLYSERRMIDRLCEPYAVPDVWGNKTDEPSVATEAAN